MDPKAIKSQLKELELQKAQTELEEARLKTASLQLDYDAAKRFHQRTVLYDPAESGRFELVGEISTRTCHALLHSVEQFAELHPGAPITITLETPGGSVLPGLGLFDSLRVIAEGGHHLTMVVRGYAASLGAILLQAGDERVVGPESMFMLHSVSSVVGGKVEEMEDDLEFTRMLNTKLMDIVARKSGGKFTGASLYRKIKKKDWWLTAEQVVENGLADRIG